MSARETACETCSGNGCENRCGYCEWAYAGPDSHKVCRSCHGTGLQRPRVVDLMAALEASLAEIKAERAEES